MSKALALKPSVHLLLVDKVFKDALSTAKFTDSRLVWKGDHYW
jgi:hypothetical protein